MLEWLHETKCKENKSMEPVLDRDISFTEKITSGKAGFYVGPLSDSKRNLKCGED